MEVTKLTDDDGEILLVPCIVSCINAAGTPDFCPVLVCCSDADYAEGDHYATAQQAVSKDDYESGGVVYDANDGPQWLFTQFTKAEFICVDIRGDDISVSGWGADGRGKE